jgi:hypothetical protein
LLVELAAAVRLETAEEAARQAELFIMLAVQFRLPL